VPFNTRFNRHCSFLFYQQNVGIGSNTAKSMKLPLKDIHIRSVILGAIVISETPQQLLICEVGQRKSTAEHSDCQILPLLHGSRILHFTETNYEKYLSKEKPT